MAGTPLHCPLCREPVPEGAAKCENCDADLRGLLAQPTASPSDVAFVRDLDAPPTAPIDPPSPVPDVAARRTGRNEETAKSFLYLCPSCGELVRAEDASCAKCGANLREVDRPAELAVEVGPARGEEEFQKCPGCGAAAPMKQTVCGLCGASLGASVPAPKPGGEPANAQAISKDEELTELEAQFAREVAAQRIERTTVTGPPAPLPAPGAAPRAPARPPRTREAGTVPTPLVTWRDYAAIATGLVTPAAAVSAVARVPGYEWGQMLLFSVLFGIGLNLTIPEAQRVARTRSFLAWIAGTVVVLAVPLVALLGSPLVAPVSLALLVAGGLASAVAAWRLPGSVGPFLPWLTGLSLLTTAAIVSIASLVLGDPIVLAVVWLVGGALAVGPAVVVGYRVSMTSLASRRLDRAERALSKRDFEGALGLYDEALALARRAGRDLDTALYGKGAALVAVGKPDEALELLDRALSTNPRNEVAWVNKGSALTRLGRLQDALKCYNSAIKVNATYEVAWNNKGNALSRLGRDAWALRCYEQALSLDPSYRTAWVNKGYVLAKLGRFDEAAECADRALRLTAPAA